jgi:putative ABC transport system permease protein
VTVQVSFGLAVVLVVLTVAASLVAALATLGTSRATLVAAARAAVQLAAASAVITVAVRHLGTAVLVAAFMWAVAAVTSARRVVGAGVVRRPDGLWVAVAIGAGAGPVLGVLLASGVVPARGIAVVPTAGILVGGAMTATSLAGRRVLDDLAARFGEYEAALALGFQQRDAVREICRPAAAAALVPALDQTRTVGLVTLPGAFVGALLGGASPAQAGAAQLLVLIGLLAAETVSVVVVLELVCAARLRRSPGRWASRP